MAGGSGERFWPVSRESRPKQLLKLASGRTMIEEAVERAEALAGAGNVLIAANELVADAMREALPNLPPENILAEPMKRNTAACLAFAAAHASRFGSSEEVSMAVLTADHAIGAPDRFAETVARALDVAESGDWLVTLGIRPTRPEIGYGYIEGGEFLDALSAQSGAKFAAKGKGSSSGARRVAHFIEKPPLEVAEEYVKEDKFFWNSGMFFWRVSTLEKAFRDHLPNHADALADMRDAILYGNRSQLGEIFGRLEPVSIDVGVIEKARNVAVLPASFPWDDVGEWSALLRFGQRDKNGNVVVGDAILEDCRDTVAYNASTSGKMLAAAGLREQIVVLTDDAALVVPLAEAQRVKSLVAKLRGAGRKELL
jgi:mannose-1-phosphate guanylyltransferase